MTEQCLPDLLTPIDPKALYAALRAAAPRAIGSDLSRDSTLVLLAQIDEETGWKSAHHFNLGNIKHVAGDGHDYCMFRCNEVDAKGVEHWYDPPSPVTWFRAYVSLEEACVDYLSLLHRRFFAAWPAVLAGNPAAFVHALKQSGYFTASEQTYMRAVVAIDAQLAREIPADAPPPFPVLNAASVARAAIAQATVQIDESVHDAPPPGVET